MSKQSLLHLTWDAWRATRGGRQAVAVRQQVRLADLVAYARSHSPFYADLYRSLSDRVTSVEQLPSVTKATLMARFDEWVTDPAIRRSEVEAFIADRSKVGQPFLGKYMVCHTSGSTGVPAMLIHDGNLNLVNEVVGLVRMLPNMLSWRDTLRLMARPRSVGLFATDGHFLGAASLKRRHYERPEREKTSLGISPLQPMARIVEQLNAYQPNLLGGYASVMTLLAEEQKAGRLHIHPMLLAPSGEWLAPECRRELEEAFHAPVRAGYACSEAPMMAYECRHGRLHINADWVIVEPIDQQGRPVPAGVMSHSCLITNLANRVQPIIRYELGDRIMRHADPCPCGSPLPSILVEGRTDDILSFRTPGGAAVRLSPLALFVVGKEIPGVRRFQFIQTGPDRLRVRLEAERTADEEQVWGAVFARLSAFLDENQLSNVILERAGEPPMVHPQSGKFRHVYCEQSAIRPPLLEQKIISPGQIPAGIDARLAN